MDFALDQTTVELRERLLAFMDEFVYPAEPVFRAQVEAASDQWATPAIVEALKQQARAQGLWNLFLPRGHGYGAGLTNTQYAPLAEVTGRSPWIAPEALNCSAPDTGNMELLSLFGTEQQRREWLRAAARRADPLGVLDDRARRRVVGCDEHRHPDRARRRRVRDQRPQVVDVGRDVATVHAADRDGRQRSGCRASPAPEHDPRAEGHAGRHGGALDEPVRLRRRPARRPRRGRLRQRPRAGIRTYSETRATASGSLRSASAPAGSTTPCARSAWPSAHWR